jgi:hypothetical protein
VVGSGGLNFVNSKNNQILNCIGFFEEMFENQLFNHISARLQGTSTKLRL